MISIAPTKLLALAPGFSKLTRRAAVNSRPVSFVWLVLGCALFMVIFENFAFGLNVIQKYPFSAENSLFLVSLPLVMISINIVLFTMVSFKYVFKPLMIVVLLCSASAAYFMDTYNVIIDDVMIDNIFRTDIGETLDLLSVNQVLYIFILGIVPALLIARLNLDFGKKFQSTWRRIGLFLTATAVLVSTIMLLGDSYASFFRENKPLRFYANPSYYIYSMGNYLASYYDMETREFVQIGLDAVLPPAEGKHKLVLFVVGETVRTDHLSLAGYQRNTNPQLQKEHLVAFKNFSSCGTSTAVSVPCMFAAHDRAAHNKAKAESSENVLDVLQRIGVSVSWLDNNSDSKGVALRVPYETYKTAATNPECDDIECRDVGMIEVLPEYVPQAADKDVLLVLHQMGNHGPAYYRRYPDNFEIFTPACKTNLLEECSTEEIINAYDNALVYTDYFLAQLIQWLKENSQNYEVALVYASDHGESLGENNLYLHGLPYMFAPIEQKEVPVLVWLADSWPNRDAVFKNLKAKESAELSHDNISHTLLGMFDVETSIYDESKDLFAD
jgi:lipid A ethanolaminephosphotransferase